MGMSRVVAAGLVALTATGVGSRITFAQGFPTRPVTIVVPFAAGGPTDVLARLLSQRMTDLLKQQVIVENVGGAAGTVGAARVARSAPDGYTLFLHNISHATAPAFYTSLSYDPIADFEPIGLVAEVPQVLVARKGLPPSSLPELVAHLKTNGVSVNMAHAGRGSGSHLCGLVLMSALGTKLSEIPYRGTGPAVTDMIGGRVDVMCDQASNTGAQIRAGSIKGYCVAAAGRVATLPELPSCGEAGLSGFLASVWHGLYAPKGTPPVVLKTVGDALRLTLDDPAVKTRLSELSAVPEPPARVTPGALQDHLKAEVAKWAGIVKAADIKPE